MSDSRNSVVLLSSLDPFSLITIESKRHARNCRITLGNPIALVRVVPEAVSDALRQVMPQPGFDYESFELQRATVLSAELRNLPAVISSWVRV